MRIHPPLDRAQFLNMAALFEGSLVVVAVILGWLTSTDPLSSLKLTWDAVGFGLICVIPMLAIFLVTYHIPLRPLQQIRSFLVNTLGPLLDQCRWFDLVLLAILAGVTEEILFRGTVEPIMNRLFAHLDFGTNARISGLAATSLLFGLAHFITPLYAVLAGIMGAYLSGVQMFEESQNLLAPIVTHAVYDWIAFLIVTREYRKQPSIHDDTSIPLTL